MKNLDSKENKVVSINIKESPAISLGSLFKDKKASLNKLGKKYTSVIDVPRHNKYTKLKNEDKQLYSNEPFFELNEKIHMETTHNIYSLIDRSKEQTFLEYDDAQGRKILFPSYVIAQYYYFRSSSMARQVMASHISNVTALKGLYKDVRLDKESGHASIVLKPNAKSRDGAEIFRFAVHKYANEMFHRIYKDMAKSKNEIKNKFEKLGIPFKYNVATLSAFFPFYGISYFEYRGIELADARILVLEIISEDSYYPFESLTIYRQAKSLANRQLQLGKVFNTLSTNIKEYMSNNVPNSSFEPAKVYTDQKVDGRLDLTDKDINYEILENDEESESTNDLIDVEYETGMSTSEAESDGDLDTAQAYIEQDLVEKPEGWDERVRAGLEAFLLMLETAQEKAIMKGKVFSYVVEHEQMLPQKPDYIKDRKKWIKGLMVDNETPRAYSCAHINYDGKNVCVFDVERDKRIEGLSLLVIRMNNNTEVSQNIINDILVDFVKEQGAWLRQVNTSSFRYKNFNHPKVITEDSINGWAERLLNSMNNI